MLEMDQILKANELSIALVAAIPALIFASLGLYGLARWLRPAPPDPRVEALPCRHAPVLSAARCCQGLHHMLLTATRAGCAVQLTCPTRPQSGSPGMQACFGQPG